MSPSDAFCVSGFNIVCDFFCRGEAVTGLEYRMDFKKSSFFIGTTLGCYTLYNLPREVLTIKYLVLVFDFVEISSSHSAWVT